MSRSSLVSCCVVGMNVPHFCDSVRYFLPRLTHIWPTYRVALNLFSAIRISITCGRFRTNGWMMKVPIHTYCSFSLLLFSFADSTFSGYGVTLFIFWMLFEWIYIHNAHELERDVYISFRELFSLINFMLVVVSLTISFVWFRVKLTPECRVTNRTLGNCMNFCCLTCACFFIESAESNI